MPRTGAGNPDRSSECCLIQVWIVLSSTWSSRLPPLVVWRPCSSCCPVAFQAAWAGHTASWSGTAGRLQHSSRVTRARSDRSRSSRRGGGPCAAQELQADGYDVGKLPEEEGDLIKSVLNDETARFNSADLNVAYKMDVPEYQRLCPYAEALEENWGKAPGDCPLHCSLSGTDCLESAISLSHKPTQI